MSKSLQVTGGIMAIAGLALLLYTQFDMKTTIETEGIPDSYGYSSRIEVSNLGLVSEKLNCTILAGILIIAGLQISLTPEDRSGKK